MKTAENVLQSLQPNTDTSEQNELYMLIKSIGVEVLKFMAPSDWVALSSVSKGLNKATKKAVKNFTEEFLQNPANFLYYFLEHFSKPEICNRLASVYQKSKRYEAVRAAMKEGEPNAVILDALTTENIYEIGKVKDKVRSIIAENQLEVALPSRVKDTLVAIVDFIENRSQKYADIDLLYYISDNRIIGQQKTLPIYLNLSGIELHRTKFEGLDLSGVNFTDAKFSSVKFLNCILSNAILENSQFEECEIKDCTCVAADFSGTKFLNSIGIAKSDFSQANFTDADFQLKPAAARESSDLSRINLQQIKLSEGFEIEKYASEEIAVCGIHFFQYLSWPDPRKAQTFTQDRDNFMSEFKSTLDQLQNQTISNPDEKTCAYLRRAIAMDIMLQLNTLASNLPEDSELPKVKNLLTFSVEVLTWVLALDLYKKASVNEITRIVSKVASNFFKVKHRSTFLYLDNYQRMAENFLEQLKKFEKQALETAENRAVQLPALDVKAAFQEMIASKSSLTM